MITLAPQSLREHLHRQQDGGGEDGDVDDETVVHGLSHRCSCSCRRPDCHRH
jgi:hypothetical protein